MWSYYGSKANVVDLYPKPIFNRIIEPFAGSARYSLKYFESDILLVDKWPVIIDIWKWLQECSPNDILKLPRDIKPGDLLKDINFDCPQAKALYGFVIGAGAERPRLTAGKRRTIQRPNAIPYCLNKIASQLYKIKHWKFICSDYTEIGPDNCTWFIDPPYQVGGHKYAMSNVKIDFKNLATWCETRNGQVMVCENTKATWMDFKPMISQRGSLYQTTEAIWTNYHTHFDNVQQQLIL